MIDLIIIVYILNLYLILKRFKEINMKLIRARLLKDLNYFRGCPYKKYDTVIIQRDTDGQTWVIIRRPNIKIRIFSYEFEEIA